MINTITNYLSSAFEQIDFQTGAATVAKKIGPAAAEFFKNISLDGVDFSGIGSGISNKAFELLNGLNLGEITSTIASQLSWSVFPALSLGYIAWTLSSTGFGLLLQYIYDRAKYAIGKPDLITEEKRTTLLSKVDCRKKNHSELSEAIFNEKLTKKFQVIAKSLKNIKRNKGYFPNILLHGPGGTGKTLIAQELAQKSGLNYIMMSGGNIQQYIKRGEHVTELNKLMKSVKNSSTPTILFIDEVESLTKTRKDSQLGAERTELLNAFLNHTGTPSQNFSIIMATNRPEDIDPAVLNRADYKLFIGPPEKPERKKIFEININKFFKNDQQSIDLLNTKIDQIVDATEGFTGRTIFKLVNNLYNIRCSTDDNKLTSGLIDGAVQDFCEQEKNINPLLNKSSQIQSQLEEEI